MENYDVILGGTFGPLHDGHREMLRTAFEFGNPLIGLTTQELSQKTRDSPRYIPAFEKRNIILKNECNSLAEKYGRQYKIFAMNHPTKEAEINTNIRAIVVSPEEKVEKRVNEINQVRTETNNLPELEMIVASKVTAEDGTRISSTRMIQGEINQHGEQIVWE